MKQVCWLGALLIGLLLAACAGSQNEKPAGPVLDLPLENLTGDQTNLSHYAGRVIIVNFWATWCVPCRTEMPALEVYYQAHREDGLQLLAVNDRESIGRVQAYITDGGYTFPVILDSDGSISNFFGGLRGMPTTIVLDRQGEVVFQHIGQLDENILSQVVTTLLK